MVSDDTGVSAEGPLAGIRVLDLSGESVLFSGRQFGELGADVVRVEPPGGSSERRRGPFVHDASGPEASLYHLHFNANKRGLVLNGSVEADRESLRALIRAADIVITSRDGLSLDTFDLTSHELAQLSPATIVVDVAPFHEEGPFRDYVGNDLIGAASSGVMYLSGFQADAPIRPGAEQAYHKTSVVATAGALIALVGRTRDAEGRGHRLHVSTQEALTITTAQTANANMYTWHGTVPTRIVAPPDGPSGATFLCKDDRWISFGVPLGAPQLWRAFVEWMAEEGFVEEFADPRWDDPVFRQENAHVSRGVISALCAKYDRAHLFHEGQRRRMLVMPLNDARDLLEDEHLRERSFFREFEHETFGRRLTDVGPPYRFSATAADFRRRAPLLDEHRDEVLAELRTLPARSRPAEGVAPGLPLEGLRVADFFWLIAGSSTSRMLADFGADVIKIESESRLDNIRAIGVQPTERGSINTNGVFNDCNTNKRSITLNLNHPRGIDLAKEIVARSDIVTNNFTGDRMDRWGLGYEDLRKVKSDIVMLTMPVMGTTGPYKRYGAYGNGVIAFAGLTQNMGFAHRRPTGIGPLYSDFSTPYVAVSAIMSAIYHHERTGEGQFIQLAQAETIISFLGTDILEVSANGQLPPRLGNRSRDHAPHGAYQCAGTDRWVAIAARDDEEWRRLALVLGRPDLADDARLSTLVGRQAHEDEIDAAITDWTRERDPWEVMALLQGRGIPAAVVEDLQDMVERDPWLSTRHLLPTQRPDDAFVYTTHAQPVWMDGQTPPLRRSPHLAEHNDEVYRGLLGLTNGDLADLIADGVLR